MMGQSRILVVGHGQPASAALQRDLTKRGFQAGGGVSTGEEALGAARETIPDVVLCDLELSGKLHGVATAARLRCAHEPAIVYVTGCGNPNELEREKGNGPLRHLLKSFSERDLQSPVETVKKFAPGSNENGGGKSALNPGHQVFDREQLLSNIGDDVNLLQAVVEIFTRDGPKSFRRIERAVACNDAEGLRKAAHKLKGMACTLAAQPVTNATSQLETMGKTGKLEEAKQVAMNLAQEIDLLIRALLSFGRELDH